MIEEASDNHNNRPLPRNVKLLGAAGLLNDVASEMIYPLMPQFLMTVLGGNRFHLGIIEGVAESVSSLLKLWAGAWSDRAGQRKGFVVFGYAMAAVARPLLGLVTVPWQFFAGRIADRIPLVFTGRWIIWGPQSGQSLQRCFYSLGRGSCAPCFC